MKFRLTAIAMALSALVITPVYAGGAGGCNYGSKWQSTSAEPQEQTEASKKLASLSMPIAEAAEEATGDQATATEKPQESTATTAEETTTR